MKCNEMRTGEEEQERSGWKAVIHRVHNHYVLHCEFLSDGRRGNRSACGPVSDPTRAITPGLLHSDDRRRARVREPLPNYSERRRLAEERSDGVRAERQAFAGEARLPLPPFGLVGRKGAGGLVGRSQGRLVLCSLFMISDEN